MATKTRAELVNMAAEELHVVGSGQSLEAEDGVTIDARVDGLFSELASRGVCDVSNEDEIPVEWCGPLSELLANECAASFGQQKKSAMERESIEERLKVMVMRSQSPNRTLQVDRAIRGGVSSLSYNRWARGF